MGRNIRSYEVLSGVVCNLVPRIHFIHIRKSILELSIYRKTLRIDFDNDMATESSALSEI